MNQIIYNNNSSLELSTLTHNNYKRRNFFKMLFLILITTCFLITLYYFYYRYDLYKSEKISKKLLNNFNITRPLFEQFKLYCFSIKH